MRKGMGVQIKDRKGCENGRLPAEGVLAGGITIRKRNGDGEMACREEGEKAIGGMRPEMNRHEGNHGGEDEGRKDRMGGKRFLEENNTNHAHEQEEHGEPSSLYALSASGDLIDDG